MVNQRIGFELPGVKDAPLAPDFWHSVVDKMKLMVGPKNLSQAVKAVPPCNLVSQLFSIGMAVARIHPDIEAVGEDLLGGGVGGEDLEAGKEEEEEEEEAAGGRAGGGVTTGQFLQFCQEFPKF